MSVEERREREDKVRAFVSGFILGCSDLSFQVARVMTLEGPLLTLAVSSVATSAGSSGRTVRGHITPKKVWGLRFPENEGFQIAAALIDTLESGMPDLPGGFFQVEDPS